MIKFLNGQIKVEQYEITFIKLTTILVDNKNIINMFYYESRNIK